MMMLFLTFLVDFFFVSLSPLPSLTPKSKQKQPRGAATQPTKTFRTASIDCTFASVRFLAGKVGTARNLLLVCSLLTAPGHDPSQVCSRKRPVVLCGTYCTSDCMCRALGVGVGWVKSSEGEMSAVPPCCLGYTYTFVG
jgi:hypothetical protein